MPSPEELIQRVIHATEVGSYAIWIRRLVMLLAAVGLAVFHLLYAFRGLGTSQAMEQAQIGREITRGHGWSTMMARPLAAGELERRGRNAAEAVWVDTYHAPIPPLLDALALLTVKASWLEHPERLGMTGDRAIATMSVLFFLAAVGVLYLIAVRLFDHTLAWVACGLVLVCDAMWQYSLSGLPQMVILFFLHLTIYALIRALEAHHHARSPAPWLAAAAAGFGLLALTHALTIWLFVPAVIFCTLVFRPHRGTAALMLGVFTVLYAPWLVRNHLVSGNAFGTAIYSAFEGVGQSEAAHMRSVRLDKTKIEPVAFRGKVRVNIVHQFNRIFEYLGWSFVAPVAAISLLHAFRRRETAALRWLIFLMWLGAILGMAVFGLREEQGVAANQLHLVFMPLMTCYGLAFLFVLLNRLELRHHIVRRAFIGFLLLLCGLPTVFSLLFARPVWAIRWPPYLPAYISNLSEWMTPEEIIASDMPWAVAWYADRRSVWVPLTVKEFAELHDFGTLGGPINGLYLTPISGSDNKLSDLMHGEYRDWTTLIVRTSVPEIFPLKWAIRHGADECVFYGDRDRRPAAN